MEVDRNIKLVFETAQTLRLRVLCVFAVISAACSFHMHSLTKEG
jgi:hypothetical protein